MGSVFVGRDAFLTGRIFRSRELDLGDGRKLRLRTLGGDELIDLVDVEEKAKAEVSGVPTKATKEVLQRAAHYVTQMAIDDKGDRIFGDAQEDEQIVLKSVSAELLIEAYFMILDAAKKAPQIAGEASAPAAH